MTTIADNSVRELDHRTNDGIDVWLLWNSQSGGVMIAVEDGRLGESLRFEIDPADAVAAFQHPFAYARPDDRDLARAA
jgi:hypothetical protein